MTNNRQKGLALALGITMLVAFLLGGCASGNTGSTGSVADSKTYVVKYAHNQKEDSPQGVGAKAFKEKVEELSEGRIQVEIYPSGSLGSLRELIESTQGGDIEMTQQPTSMIGNFVPEALITDLPWLFESEEHMWNAMNGEAGKLIDEKLVGVGLVNLGYMHGGAKVFTTDNVRVESLAGFSGLQMRAMATQIVMDTFIDLGMNPVPIDFSELYNALQQGVVDGQENPNQTCYMNNYYEVQKYTISTNHAYMIYANVVNKAFYDSLPVDLQQVMMEAMAYAREIERETINSEEDLYVQTAEAGGMEFVALSEEALQEMKDATHAVWEKNRESLGEEFYDKFVGLVEAAK